MRNFSRTNTRTRSGSSLMSRRFWIWSTTCQTVLPLYSIQRRLPISHTTSHGSRNRSWPERNRGHGREQSQQLSGIQPFDATPPPPITTSRLFLRATYILYET